MDNPRSTGDGAVTVSLQDKVEAVITYISNPAADALEVSKQTKSLAAELMVPTRDQPFSDNELNAICKLVVFLLEGTSRNFRLLALALLCNGSALYNTKQQQQQQPTSVASLSPPTSPTSPVPTVTATSSLFYRFWATCGGATLWIRCFDICACDISGNAEPFEATSELSALLFVVSNILSIIRSDAQKTPSLRLVESAENIGRQETSKASVAVSSPEPAEFLGIALLIRLRDLALGRAFVIPRKSSSHQIHQVVSFVDELRRTVVSLLREAAVWAPRRNSEACGIVQALIDLFLIHQQDSSALAAGAGNGGGGGNGASGATQGTQAAPTVGAAGTVLAAARGGSSGPAGNALGGAAVVSPFISHSDIVETLVQCCFVGKLSPQDTSALFFPYVDVAVAGDHQSEDAAAARRGKCELVLRFLASSQDGIAVFNATAPLGLRLLIDALGLAGGSTKRKMLLMHIFVVMLHAAAPHREVQVNGRWSSYAAVDSTITKQFFGARSFVVSKSTNEEKNEEEEAKEREQEEFDVIDDEDDDVQQKALRVEGPETDVPVSVEAEPTTFFARDATLGALLLVLEREGLSRALISVLLPTVEELDPPLAEGSIALLQILLNLMGNLLSYEVTIAINQALDNAIAHLLRRRNPIIGALIAKALPRPTVSSSSTSVISGGSSLLHLQQQQHQQLVPQSLSPNIYSGSPSGGKGSSSPPGSPQLQQQQQQQGASGGGGGSSTSNNNGNHNGTHGAGSNNNIQLRAESNVPPISNASLGERIEQAKILKSNKPLTEWNLFMTLDVVQSPVLMAAVVAKEKIPTRFVKHLLHFYRCDGLGDARYFGGEPFRSIPRETAISTLGTIGVHLVAALLQHPEATNLVECEIPNTLADFFVGCLMNPDSKETLLKNMSGDYLKWIRCFTGSQHGLKLLSACDFFNRIRSAATTNKASEVWEMVVKSFSAKPGQNPDALGRCYLPTTDPRPQFYSDVLRTTLNFDPSKASPMLIVSNGRLRTAALSQLFVLAARARFSNREVLFAATQVVFEVMTMSTTIGGAGCSSSNVNNNSSNSNNNLNNSKNNSSRTSNCAGKGVIEKHDPALLADCDLAAQLLSMWIRMGGIDSDEWLAFESACEGHLDKHVEKDYVQNVLHSCYSQPGSTEGDTPIGDCLRKCAQRLLQHLGSSPEKLAAHVFGPLKKSFDESHFYNRNDHPPLPGARRHGSLRPQLLGALAESEYGATLLKESALFTSLVSAVNQVATLVPSGEGSDRGAVGGIASSPLMMSCLQRDASSVLSWAPSPTYSWDSSADPAAVDFHHRGLAKCSVPQLNNEGTGGSNSRHQNIHVALLALGSICSSDAGAELVGLETLTSVVAIASASLSNHASLSSFVSTSMITLSLLSQSSAVREILSSCLTSVGTVRFESYDPSSSSKNLANAKVAFFSPASIAEIQAQRDLVSSVKVQHQQTSFGGVGSAGANRVSPTAQNVSFQFPIFSTESFASVRQFSSSVGAASGLYGGAGGGERSLPFASSANYRLRQQQQLQQQVQRQQGNMSELDFMSSNSEVVQNEPLKSVMSSLHSPSGLKTKLEKLWKQNTGYFSDLENKRLIRLLMAQPIFVAAECRHLIALFFYKPKSKVKSFVES